MTKTSLCALAWIFFAAIAQPQEVRAVPTVRVLLIECTDSLEVACSGPVRLEIPPSGKPRRRWHKLPRTTIGLTGTSFRIDGRKLRASWLTLVAEKKPFKIGKRRYAQKLHLVLVKGKGFRVVNEVDLENYVKSVINWEIGARSHIEALKAQAIAARSYAAAGLKGFPKARKRPPVWDVYCDTRSQVYRGIPPKSARLDRAMEESAALVVTFRKQILRTYYSAACGGTTRGVAEWKGGSSVKPLSGVTCGFCDTAPRGRWKKTLTLREVSKALAKETQGARVRKVEVSSVTPSGRPSVITLQCATGALKVKSKRFRDALDISTTMFRIRQEGRTLHLAGAGHGHGVGLCQIGTREMALKGWSAERILAHYYPGSKVEAGYRVRTSRSSRRSRP